MVISKARSKESMKRIQVSEFRIERFNRVANGCPGRSRAARKRHNVLKALRVRRENEAHSLERQCVVEEAWEAVLGDHAALDL